MIGDLIPSKSLIKEFKCHSGRYFSLDENLKHSAKQQNIRLHSVCLSCLLEVVEYVQTWLVTRLFQSKWNNIPKLTKITLFDKYHHADRIVPIITSILTSCSSLLFKYSLGSVIVKFGANVCEVKLKSTWVVVSAPRTVHSSLVYRQLHDSYW